MPPQSFRRAWDKYGVVEAARLVLKHVWDDASKYGPLGLVSPADFESTDAHQAVSWFPVELFEAVVL